MITTTTTNRVSTKKRSATGWIILTWLLAGTLDAMAASIQFYLVTGKDPRKVWKFVASGALGNKAITGGDDMVAWGLLFHYLIALSFTLFFFFLYPRIRIAAKNFLITGIIYGLFVWVIMNRVVVPLSQAPKIPFVPLKALIAATILVVCIGIPIAGMTKTYYKDGH